MISKSEAEKLVEQHLQGLNREVPGGVALMHDSTIERPYGWVFFFNSRRFLETGDPLESLLGNSPILVEARDGHMTHLGTALPISDSLKQLEIERGLVSAMK